MWQWVRAVGTGPLLLTPCSFTPHLVTEVFPCPKLSVLPVDFQALALVVNVHSRLASLPFPSGLPPWRELTC